MGHALDPSGVTQEDGTSSSTSHVEVRPLDAEQTVVVSLRTWGASAGLEIRALAIVLVLETRRRAATDSFMVS